jgi:hypothetical protein
MDNKKSVQVMLTEQEFKQLKTKMIEFDLSWQELLTALLKAWLKKMR